MILLIGSEGSMGKRYKAIFNYLDVKYHGVDVGVTGGQVHDLAKRSKGIVIASPTDTHFNYLMTLQGLKKPILCEKPITKDLKQLAQIITTYKSNPLAMMMQYSMYSVEKVNGLTVYDYFRHGSDGLFWDCIQPIGLAEGDVILREKSPIWTCMINGKILDQAYMDTAYVNFVDIWLSNPNHDKGMIYMMHEKVIEAIKNDQKENQ